MAVERRGGFRGKGRVSREGEGVEERGALCAQDRAEAGVVVEVMDSILGPRGRACR